MADNVLWRAWRAGRSREPVELGSVDRAWVKPGHSGGAL